MKLVTQSQLEIAQSAMSALRHAVTNTTKGGTGADAQGKLNTLGLQLKATNAALHAIRGSAAYHVGCKSLTTEFERLEKTATNLLADLATAVNYKGLRRSAMTLQQKSKYINEHGQEKFHSLPY